MYSALQPNDGTELKEPMPKRNKSIFIRVALPGEPDGGYIDTPEEVKKIIDEMVYSAENGDFGDCYEISPVEMTNEEFENLPDFTGF